MIPTTNNHPVNVKLLAALLILSIGVKGLKAQSYPGYRTVTYEAKNMRLVEFFWQVYKQTGMTAFYNDEQISSDERITGNFVKEPLDNVLAFILRKRGMKWCYRTFGGEGTFVIKYKENRHDPDIGELPAFARGIIAKGIVTDEQGTPLVNASVIAQGKGKGKGAHTNVAGRFEITGLQPQAKILVRCLGYNPKEVAVSEAEMNIKLKQVVSGLDEVLVFGYTKSSRRLMTGSISRITAEDIAQQPVSNPIAALQGRVTGLNIIQLNGLPGSNFKLELRGRNSIGSGNSPLFVMDGVPLPTGSLSWDYNSTEGPGFIPSTAAGLGANRSASILNVINVADIASIDVLKDADATAIYGSRGANGVILITTKKGKPSTGPVFNTNVYNGFGQVEHMIKYLDTRQYVGMRREAFNNDGAIPGLNDHDINGDWDTTRYTDWQRRFIGGSAAVTDAQLSLSGGSSDASIGYLVSGGYRQESTAYPGSFRYKKGGGRVNLFFTTPDKHFKATINAGYVTDDNQLPSVDLTAFSKTAPNAPEAYTVDGALNWEKGFDNPFAALGRKYRATSDNLLISGSLSYWATPWLELKANLGYNRMTTEEVQTNPRTSYHPVYNTQFGNAHFAYANIKNWIIEPQGVFNKQLGPGYLSATLGATFQQDLRDQQLFFATGYIYDEKLDDIMAAGDVAPEGAAKSNYRYNAMFGRINYNLQEKYILNLTGRRDGSSRFGPGRQFANFGAVGAAWIFSEEPLIEKVLPWLSFGKLRASHGITGNDQIRDYRYIPTYGPSPPYQGVPGGSPAELKNTDYSWELVTKSEIGLELGLFKNRAFIIANYYHNRTSNQLIEDNPPGLGRFRSILRNMDVIVHNTGLELEISGTCLKRGKLTWSAALNLSIPRNKLVSFPDIGQNDYSYYYTVGEPLNIFKGFHMTGVDPVTGTYQFEDRNKDGKISTDPVTGDFNYTRQLGVFYYGGLQSKLRYKGWQLDILLQFVKQNGYNYLYSYTPPGPGTNINQPVSILSRWQRPGDLAGLQRLTQSWSSDAAISFVRALSSDQVITDASYLRLKNLSLSFDLPAAPYLPAGKIYLQAQNLLTFSGYPGRNPETSISPLETYPPLRVWTAGIKLCLEKN